VSCAAYLPCFLLMSAYAVVSTYFDRLQYAWIL
jgi:hypothetical protein